MNRNMKGLRLVIYLLVVLITIMGCSKPYQQTQSADSEEKTELTNDISQDTNGDTDTEEKLGGTITFWMQKYGESPEKQQERLDKITEDFKEKTGVTVEYSIVDWAQALTKYTLASTGGEAPDVADTFFIYSLVKMGGDQYGPMIIDDIAEEIGVDKFYDFADPECFVDGHWYGLPWRGDTRVAMYNEKHFQEAGIKEFPKTFDELVEVGKKLTKYDSNGEISRSGYLFGQSNARFDQSWFALLAGFGGSVMDSDFKEFTFDSKAGKKSLQFMQDSITEYNIIPKSVVDPSFNSSDAFAAEKASIVLGVSPDTKMVINNTAPQVAEVMKSAVMPSETGSGNSSVAFAAPICVFKNTENPEASKAFLKYFVSKDVQLETMKALSLISVWKDVMSDPYFSNDDWFRNIVEQNLRAQTGDMPLPKWSQIDAFPQGPINTMCTAAVAGESVETAIQNAMDEIDRIQSEDE